MNSRQRNLRRSTPCPRCGKLISINTDRCVHCGLIRPGIFLSIPILSDFIQGEPPFVNSIILTCAALYILALALDITGSMNFAGGILNLLSPTNESLYNLGMGGRIPWNQGRWWTMITANYLHGGILHIAFNMLWLSRIGPWVIELYGSSRFWIIYTIAGLTGSIVTTLAGTPLFVGASGAIFGLFGALIYYGRHRGGTFGSTIFRQMLIWAAIAFIFGFIGTGIDNWGHFGGFIGGIVAAILIGYQERFRQSLYHHLLATILLLLVVVCFVFMAIAFFS